MLLFFFSGEFPSQGYVHTGNVRVPKGGCGRSETCGEEVATGSAGRSRFGCTGLDGFVVTVVGRCGKYRWICCRCDCWVILAGPCTSTHFINKINKYMCPSQSSERRIHPMQPGLWQNTLHLPSRQKNKSNWRRRCHACGDLASSVCSCAWRHHRIQNSQRLMRTRIRKNAAWTEDPIFFSEKARPAASV